MTEIPSSEPVPNTSVNMEEVEKFMNAQNQIRQERAMLLANLELALEDARKAIDGNPYATDTQRKKWQAEVTHVQEWIDADRRSVSPTVDANGNAIGNDRIRVKLRQWSMLQKLREDEQKTMREHRDKTDDRIELNTIPDRARAALVALIDEDVGREEEGKMEKLRDQVVLLEGTSWNLFSQLEHLKSIYKEGAPERGFLQKAESWLQSHSTGYMRSVLLWLQEDPTSGNLDQAIENLTSASGLLDNYEIRLKQYVEDNWLRRYRDNIENQFRAFPSEAFVGESVNVRAIEGAGNNLFIDLSIRPDGDSAEWIGYLGVDQNGQLASTFGDGIQPLQSGGKVLFAQPGTYKFSVRHFYTSPFGESFNSPMEKIITVKPAAEPAA